MVAVTRAAAIPLAVVVFGLVALTEPSSLVRSTLLVLGVSAVGLALLAAASWWQASGDAHAQAPNARGIAVEEAADQARMDSDAG
jgi:hypothetical protein